MAPVNATTDTSTPAAASCAPTPMHAASNFGHGALRSICCSQYTQLSSYGVRCGNPCCCGLGVASAAPPFASEAKCIRLSVRARWRAAARMKPASSTTARLTHSPITCICGSVGATCQSAFQLSFWVPCVRDGV